MTRRELLRSAGFGIFGLAGGSSIAGMLQEPESFKGKKTFDRIVAKAAADGWAKLPIGELMGKIARELEGIPYVGYTIELSKDREMCAVDFTGLDCVTFFENTLDLARMIKRGRHRPEDLMAEVTFTRYRNGRLGDYTSRLHYTTDWFYDNERKGVVKILTPELPGAEPFTQKVGYMTEHPESYRQLAAHPELVPKIGAFEAKINARSLTYLPMDRLAEAETLLKTGDIVGVCTTAEGLDIAHTGLVYKDEQGVAHFMDASSAKSRMKVTLEGRISESLNWSKKLTGVMIARPLELKRGPRD
ncbi:N-acetylmuramoyl-L-alanine amidase-like domain-containing protein [Fimbriimonas ginsengisoli]|uniref:Putative lipoprotein n=1 Tax=Fimbriimonas ginsengisoli Gsoil 348 TaxID=661478 RepID=A0A068NMW2_FIMGI|nr:N-acetylmuramoyl-L-alanine amidase-like domain-containing protein [Fimbriimonas ginsengisoli]AIE84908.1 putative lipoprotein [Fimbriimonas ginsengisoli Gsoil 348]